MAAALRILAAFCKLLTASLCILAVVAWLVPDYPAFRAGIRPLVLATRSVQEKLSVVKKRNLTAGEEEDFNRDGFILLRDVLPDRELLKELHVLLRQYQQPSLFDPNYRRPFLYNGAIRAVIRAGHVTELLRDVVKGPHSLFESPVRGWDLSGKSAESPDWRKLPAEIGPWRKGGVTAPGEMWADVQNGSVTVSAYLAITDLPHTLEFIRGSQPGGAQQDKVNGCLEQGWRGATRLDLKCLRGLAKEQVNPSLEHSVRTWIDLRAGDLLLFSQGVFMREVQWPRSSLALSLNVFRPPEDASMDEFLKYVCDEAEAIFHRRGTLEDKRRDPLACLRSSMLPMFDWDMKRLGLPPEEDLSNLGRFFVKVLAGVEGMLLSI